jgi:hypothetical protein
MAGVCMTSTTHPSATVPSGTAGPEGYEALPCEQRHPRHLLLGHAEVAAASELHRRNEDQARINSILVY